MAQLRINLAGAPGDTGVAAELRDQDFQASRFVVHAGQTALREVPPGTYLLRLDLPGGAISTHVQVSESGGNANVVAPPSPHEWLARETMLGLVDDSQYAGKPPLDVFPGIWLRLWVRTDGQWVIVPDAISPRAADQYTAKFDVRPWHRDGLSHLAILQFGAAHQPWTCTALPPVSASSPFGFATVIVHAELGRGSPEPRLRVDPTTQSGDIDMLLRYLVRGKLEDAETLGSTVVDAAQRASESLQQAERLLRDKQLDPFGAAVGGYYLLRSLELTRMHDWPNNFANWIEWLPDAAIVHAWQLLLQASGDSAVNRGLIRARLLDAQRRGTPVLTEGLRRLYDGLGLLDQDARRRGEQDAEVEQALGRVYPIAAHADWTRAYTSFPGSRPDRPGEGATGTPPDPTGLVFVQNSARVSVQPAAVVGSSAAPAPAPPRMAQQSWATGAKDLVMTALATARVWVTFSHGILTEVFWPAVDQPQIKDFGFLVAGGGWWREVKRVDVYTLSAPDPAAPLPTITHSGDQYQLTLRIVPDPARDAVLIEYELMGQGVRLYPLLAPHLGIYRQDRANEGSANVAWVDGTDNALFASAEHRAVCLIAAPGFTRGSAGYVGDTDGWTDFARNQAMTWTYSSAGPGVVALMGELVSNQGVLALGFGATPTDARTIAQDSIRTGYPSAAAMYSAGWNAWTAGLSLPVPGPDLTPPVLEAVRQSAAVLKVHEDHTRQGAFVAGLTTPWGEDTNKSDGYHVVWCRDATESGLALAVLGRTDEAAALLAFLTANQRADGSWPRCFFLDGSFDASAPVQLDEVAFPVLLAGRLEENQVMLPPGTDDMIRMAARFLAHNGPISGVERWEENEGGSAFAIGLQIAAMIVAATRLNGVDQQFALALADNWNERLEAFTYVSGGDVDRFFGTDGHYVRIGPAVEQIKLGNQPDPTPGIAAEALVGMEFLYLARLGLRDPLDKRITDTLSIVDKMISRDTPSGRTYYRYNVDGYGEWLDGSGWEILRFGTHFGIGRPWTLLAGERGHYELLVGRSAATQMQAMLAMRGRGGLLPEQIWDANPLPWRGLQAGKATHSAMPLAWAHSELIKLAVASSTGRPVEMLTRVTERYGGQVPVSAEWFWRDAAPVRELPPGRTLVVADERPFTLHFGFDDRNKWQDVRELPSRTLGLGMYGVPLEPALLAGRQSVLFVRRYQDGSWEQSTGNEVRVGVLGPPSLRLSLSERGRVAAAGRESPRAF